MSIFGNDPVTVRVKAADLARFDDPELTPLNEAREALLRSHLAATDARLAVRRARDDYERISARRGGAKADVKLAKAERSSARAHTDAQGALEAERSISTAQGEKSLLDMRIAWLRAELAAAEAREAEMSAGAWAAEADYELERARLVASDRTRGEANLQAFVRQVEACHKALENARHRSVQRRAEADKQRNAWQRASAPLETV
jgi:hypothetical protein